VSFQYTDSVNLTRIIGLMESLIQRRIYDLCPFSGLTRMRPRSSSAALNSFDVIVRGVFRAHGKQSNPYLNRLRGHLSSQLQLKYRYVLRWFLGSLRYGHHISFTIFTGYFSCIMDFFLHWLSWISS
jgi:hypothetical protein